MGTFVVVQRSLSVGISFEGTLPALEWDPRLLPVRPMVLQLSCCNSSAGYAAYTGCPGNCFNSFTV
jgi:hypothetical protein